MAYSCRQLKKPWILWYRRWARGRRQRRRYAGEPFTSATGFCSGAPPEFRASSGGDDIFELTRMTAGDLPFLCGILGHFGLYLSVKIPRLARLIHGGQPATKQGQSSWNGPWWPAHSFHCRHLSDGIPGEFLRKYTLSKWRCWSEIYVDLTLGYAATSCPGRVPTLPSLCH